MPTAYVWPYPRVPWLGTVLAGLLSADHRPRTGGSTSIGVGFSGRGARTVPRTIGTVNTTRQSHHGGNSTPTRPSTTAAATASTKARFHHAWPCAIARLIDAPHDHGEQWHDAFGGHFVGTPSGAQPASADQEAQVMVDLPARPEPVARSQLPGRRRTAKHLAHQPDPHRMAQRRERLGRGVAGRILAPGAGDGAGRFQGAHALLEGGEPVVRRRHVASMRNFVSTEPAHPGGLSGGR